MFLGLGQYSEEDIALNVEAGIADMWTGSSYDPGMTPASWVTAINQQPSSMTSGGLLPVLQSVVSGAASIVGKFFDVQTAKTQAEALQKARQTGVITPTVTGVQTAGFSLGGSWPILAIVGIGAFLVMRGKKGADVPKRKRGKRRER